MGGGSKVYKTSLKSKILELHIKFLALALILLADDVP
jgi:hypothetical protein